MKKAYIVIYERGLDKLEERVAEAMEQGYKPSGSLVYVAPVRGDELMDGKDTAFIQPMILKN